MCGVGTLIASWRSGAPSDHGVPAFPTEQNALATNRTALKRKQYRTITPEAVEAFKRMRGAGWLEGMVASASCVARCLAASALGVPV